jgi:hypothetical protein
LQTDLSYFMQHANDWLKKQLELENITVSIQAQHIASDNGTEATPLLRLKSLRIAALAPVFAVLADRSVVGQTTAVIDIDLHPLICCISSKQVAWLRVFAQAIPTVLAARGEAAALARLMTSHLLCKWRIQPANSSRLVRCPL